MNWTADGPIRILHVDDDPDLADVTATLLEDESERFAVETAESASEGLERLDTGAFDCVVSDYDMPGQTGIEFLEAVRERYPGLPFILFTGKGSEEVASDAISAGVTDYLQKESTREQYSILANRVGNAVQQANSREALAASQNRLSLFIEQSPLGVIEWDDEFDAVRVNDAAEEILGYAEADLEGQSWEMIVPEPDREKVGEVVDELLDADGGYHSVNENVRADGEIVVCEWHNRVVTDDDGETVAIFSQFQGVTERKQRERELKRYESVVENTEDGVYVFDEDARFEFVNHRVVDVSGIPRDGWTGQHVSILADLGVLTGAETTAIEDGVEAVGRGDETEVRVELHPDVPHDLEVLELRLTPFESNSESGRVIGYSRDITDFKSREQNLERLQRQAQSLMAARTVEETAQVAADAARETLGAELSGFHRVSDDGQRLELVTDPGTLCAALDDVPEYDRAESDPVDEIVWEVLETGEPLVVDSVDGHERLAGSTRAKSVVVYPIADQGVFIVSATEPEAFDETDKRLVEILAATLTAALQRTSRETLLRERERELTRQNKRLDEFASIVSHDLRNPLTVAQGRLELVDETYESEHLDVVARAHERMEALIENILTLAQEGETACEREGVSLADTARRCWEHVQADDATLVTDVSCTVRADRSHLKQLLENVMQNAVQHGGPGVTVTVGEMDGGFYVEDDGVGIPDDSLEQVFESGYSTTPGGTGLGLRIVERVAEMHGWDVHATTSADGGTRIEITGVSVAPTTP